MAGRIINCIGRRRVTVTQVEGVTQITIWLRDPPSGTHIATLQLTKEEVQKLMAELTEVMVGG